MSITEAILLCTLINVLCSALLVFAIRRWGIRGEPGVPGMVGYPGPPGCNGRDGKDGRNYGEGFGEP